MVFVRTFLRTEGLGGDTILRLDREPNSKWQMAILVFVQPQAQPEDARLKIL